MADVVVPRGTSWMSVLGGWIASIGMMALLAPLAAAAVATRASAVNDVSLAVPAVLAIVIAYLVGGYVAGRMAGYRTSWHGMMTAFWGLFVVLALLLVGVAAERGMLGGLRLASPDGAYPWAFGPQAAGEAVTFGAIIGFLATIFAGWLGGLLAPSRVARVVASTAPVAPVEPVATTTVHERERVAPAPRQGYRLLPSLGRKGGERVERRERVEADGDREIHETRVDRR